jgi:transposase InsO family protein
LEWEVLSRNNFRDALHAQAVVIDWCYTFYNHQRRHVAADGLSPVNYEIRESKTKRERHRKPSTISGEAQACKGADVDR